ncbi:alpha-D-glucose phosphate-specific phosphoglucomutase [Ruegeria arenilitoris]|uniref:alpha-D-glucose phosphate-specific phosphoglucomutase n=1 Tax=Ruegeria arenilitoris TaxID=1173585 RepID=UPI00147D92B7|nr:alpha-D-glucose phosphate-specific phosphoglucomutase [Ruegeria arenilitoris]
MSIVSRSCIPFSGQKPGTSGLRKKTRVFMQPGYLESFVQSIFNAIGGAKGKDFVIGGDGRFFNAEAIQEILRMAAANEAKRAIIGQNGLLSTPAASNLIRKREADGGFILSASHNPGGIDADFGLKFNGTNGGPASESLTEKFYTHSQKLSEYTTLDADDIDLSRVGVSELEGMVVEVVDPVADYAALMREIFDFNRIRALLADGFTLSFDAMHAVTGPYATAILEDELGAPKGSVLNAVPSVDFGKGHPDPNPIWAKPLVDLVMSPDGPDFAAASDGDGDRNMILGKGIYVTPSDSLAVLAANAHLAPGYVKGLAGVARSMPTSAAVDRVAERLGLDCYETPTGWKFFGNLLDAGRITLCGEESAGTGSDHVREKDGLWAVLLWLNILAERRISVRDVMVDHWQTYGRNYYSRHDYEAVDSAKASQMIADLTDRLPKLPGSEVGRLVVATADQFYYKDPVDGSVAKNQGIRIVFENGSRGVIRLSGTGTDNATIRVYLEQFVPKDGDLKVETQTALRDVSDALALISKLQEKCGRASPDIMT